MDQYGNLNIIDGLENLEKKEAKEISDKFIEKAKEFSEQGFEEFSVCELLELEGCPREASKKIAKQACNNLPENFHLENPPKSFEDVSKKVEKTIHTAEKEKLNTYLNKYAGKDYSQTINRILIARDNKESGLIIAELVKEVEPLVTGLILTNLALASEGKEIAIDEKERLEQDLFGVWPVSLIIARRKIDKADKTLAKRSKVNPDNGISFI